MGERTKRGDSKIATGEGQEKRGCGGMRLSRVLGCIRAVERIDPRTRKDVGGRYVHWLLWIQGSKKSHYYLCPHSIFFFEPNAREYLSR